MKRTCGLVLTLQLVTGMLIANQVHGAAAPEKKTDFLTVSPDVAAVASGEVSLSLSGSPAGMLSNPAASAFIGLPKLSFSAIALPANTQYRFGGMVYPTSFGSFGASYARLGYDLPDDPSDSTIALNYSYRFTRDFPTPKEYGSVGMNIKQVSNDAGGLTNSGSVADIGAVYRIPVSGDLCVGAVYRNLGSSVKCGPAGIDELLSGPTFSLLYRVHEWSRLALMADASSYSGENIYSAGMSIMPFYPVTLRAGWRQAQHSDQNGLRAGVGLDFGGFSLNYAATRGKDSTVVHFMGVDIGFGRIAEPSSAYSYYLDYYFSEAKKKFRSRDYIGARELLEDILTVYPEHQQSKEYLEKISMALDTIEEARQDEVSKCLKRAEQSLLDNNIFKARKYFNYVLKMDPQNAVATEGNRRIDVAFGNYQHEETRRRKTHDIELLWKTGLEDVRREKYESAKKAFDKIVEYSPEDAQAKAQLEAIDRKLYEIKAQKADALYLQGVEKADRGEYVDALKVFADVSALIAQYKETERYVAECHQKILEQEEALKAQQAAAKKGKSKDDVERVYGIAVQLYESGEYTEAIAQFDRARDLAARGGHKSTIENAKSYILSARRMLADKCVKRGEDYAQKGKRDAALAEYRKALEYDPDNVSAKAECDKINEESSQELYEQGIRAFADGDKKTAIDCLRKSLALQPGNTAAQRALDRLEKGN